MMTNAVLQQMYHEFNRKYFRNRLPKDMVVRYERLRNFHGVTGVKFDRPLYIMIDWELRRCKGMTALTLLHECVHVEDTRGGHGPRFHKRMLKLAKQGAFRKWW